MATIAYRDILRTKNAKRKPVLNSRFCHRITELETLLGKYDKWGIPYDLVIKLLLLIVLIALFFKALFGGYYKSYTRIWGHFLGKQQ